MLFSYYLLHYFVTNSEMSDLVQLDVKNSIICEQCLFCWKLYNFLNYFF